MILPSILSGKTSTQILKKKIPSYYDVSKIQTQRLMFVKLINLFAIYDIILFFVANFPLIIRPTRNKPPNEHVKEKFLKAYITTCSF